MSQKAPPEIAAFAFARAAAREARDWPEADRLRAEIEAAGWSVVDRGTRYTLRPAHAPDLEADGAVRYGRSGAVASRLEEPVSAPVTVVIVADDRPDDVARAFASVRLEAPEGTQIVVVADDPTPAQAAALSDLEGPFGAAAGKVVPEILWTSARLGRPTALNAGLRRAVGAVVVVLGADLDWSAGAIGDLVDALGDPTVAIAGLRGLQTSDLRRFSEGGDGEVAVVSGTLAFRRADLIARGPLEERFLTNRGLDAWWSLTLRDEGESAPPRRALVVEDGGGAAADHDAPEEGSRAGRRDYYRLLERFGGRVDLLAIGPSDPGRPGD
jgi:hypothetical protein